MKTAQIRNLNDELRRNIFTAPALGEVVFTAGVAALRDYDRFALLDEVRCFEDFTPDNDPYGEHDFGCIDFRGERYFWKIDYYDTPMMAHSLDKSDPQLTRRVLTIMRADEY
jgi:hypothetical protein